MRFPISNRNRFIFLVVSFLFWFSHFIYVPILSPYLESMGGQYAYIGIVLGSYGLMQFLFRIPIGIFSDFIRMRRPFIIVGLLTSLTSCLTFALTDSLGWILLARSLAGIAAASWVVFTILYSSYFEEREMHRAMGDVSFIVVMAQFLGMGVSGFLVKEWGWQILFWLGAVCSTLAVILSFLIYEPKDGVKKEPIKFKDLVIVMKEPQLLKVSLLSIVAHSIIFTTMFGFSPALALEIGLKASDISWLVVAFMVPHAIATLFIGKFIVPFIGQWNALKSAFFLTTIFTLLTPIVETKFWFFVVQGFNGFALGLLFPLLLGMAIESIPLQKRATAMGVYQALYAIGMFTGPFLAGFWNSIFGIKAGFYFVGILGLIATVLAIFWTRGQVYTEELIEVRNNR